MSGETTAVLPAGMSVTIMIYEKATGTGVLITCTGSGKADMPGFVSGEAMSVTLLGAFDLDIEHGDPAGVEKIEDLLKASFGEKVLQAYIQDLHLNASGLGFPLAFANTR